MSPEELKARARRVPEEMLTQGDLTVADALIAPDCVHHTPAPLAPGVEGVKRWVRALRRAFPDLSAVVDDAIAEGDTVAQRITCRGTQEGAFLGIPPTGRRATWRVLEIQRVGPDGKFVERWCSGDMLGLLEQLGALTGTALGLSRERMS